jgi:hypothetical protein
VVVKREKKNEGMGWEMANELVKASPAFDPRVKRHGSGSTMSGRSVGFTANYALAKRLITVVMFDNVELKRF